MALGREKWRYVDLCCFGVGKKNEKKLDSAINISKAQTTTWFHPQYQQSPSLYKAFIILSTRLQHTGVQRVAGCPGAPKNPRLAWQSVIWAAQVGEKENELGTGIRKLIFGKCVSVGWLARLNDKEGQLVSHSFSPYQNNQSTLVEPAADVVKSGHCVAAVPSLLPSHV